MNFAFAIILLNFFVGAAAFAGDNSYSNIFFGQNTTGCPGGYHVDPSNPQQCIPDQFTVPCAPAGDVPPAGQPCCDGNIPNPTCQVL